jgi:hypothetical protein
MHEENLKEELPLEKGGKEAEIARKKFWERVFFKKNPKMYTFQEHPAHG